MTRASTPRTTDRHAARFGYLVGRVDKLVRDAIEQVLADADLKLAEYTAMSILERRPGLSNAQLARRALVSPQAMNQAMAGLIDRGLVDRTPHPTNGRVLQVRLTTSGARLLRRIEPRIDDIEADLLAELAPDRRDELVEALAVIAELDAAGPAG